MSARTRFVFAGAASQRVLLVCAAFLLLCQATPAAEQGAVQLEVNPSTVQLSPGDSADVMLVIRNTSSSPADQLQLQWSAPAGLTITPAQPGPKSVAPGGVAGWPVHIAAQPAGRTVGALQFWLRYSRSENGEGASGVAVASLALEERTPLAIDKLVEGKLEGDIDQLNEKHPAWIYMVITNKAAIPITITELRANKPDFIIFCDPASKDPCPPDKKNDLDRKQFEKLTQSSVAIDIKPPVSLQPQSSWVYPLVAQATDEARAGKEQVVFDIGLSWTDAGRPQSGSVLIAQSVPVNVFGESAILTLLGVPSFFMLPGFLALTTFGALWMRIAPKTKIQPELKIPEISLVSVTLSLIAMEVYPLFTHRDYLEGYGLSDVMMVWFGSVVIAAGAWILTIGGTKLVHRVIRFFKERAEQAEKTRQEQEEARRTPTARDTPLEVLEKLKINGIDFPLEQAEVTLGGEVSLCFLILPAGSGQSQSWVCPQARLTRAGPVTRSREDILNDIAQAGDDRNNIAQALSGAEQAGWITKWGESGAIAGPMAVDTAHVNKIERKRGFPFVDF